MLEELDLLIRTKEVQNQREIDMYNAGINSSGKYIDKLSKNDGTNKKPIIMGGQLVNEAEFDDEDLCVICCQTK